MAGLGYGGGTSTPSGWVAWAVTVAVTVASKSGASAGSDKGALLEQVPG